MKIKINKLVDYKNYPTYYLNICCKMNDNNISEINLNYNSSFAHFIEGQNQKTYFIADKLESPKETVKTLLERNKFVPKDLQKNIDGRFIVINIKKNLLRIFSDKLGRTDLFYSKEKNIYTFSTVLNDFSTPGYNDDLGLINFFMLYGSRAPRKQTLFSNIKRLGVGDVLLINKDLIIKNNYINLKKYNNHNQKKYNELFLKALEKRGNKDLNVVYLSSGWDSTSILAGLKYIYGAKKVVAVTSRATNSKRTGTHNKYEINRAVKIAKAIGVKHYIVDTDYSKLKLKNIKEWLNFTKKYGLYGSTAMGQYQLAKFVSNSFGKETTAFSGENSDGVHNLGFSQYVSIFHKYSRDFREYFDKMRLYLYGPTFLKSITEGYVNEDPAFKIIKMFAGEHNFNKVINSKNSIIKEMLTSCFLYSNRIPYFKGKISDVLNNTGIKYYYNQIYKLYLLDFESKFDYNNPYDTYLNIYPSFHWQSSNVACVELAGSENGIYNKLPFQDFELVSYISSSPESFGKGLDLNPVKYPLKRFLEEKMKFPMEIGLGPHSYIYDTRPNFSILGEYIYGSNLTNHFRLLLKDKSIIDVFNEKYFEKKVLEKLINNYIKGKEIFGSDLTNLSKLVELSFHNPGK